MPRRFWFSNQVLPDGDPESPLERHDLPESLIDDDGDPPETDGAADEKASPSAMTASCPAAVHFDNDAEHSESLRVSTQPARESDPHSRHQASLLLATRPC